MPATKKAPANDPVTPTMKPVTIGATAPIRLLTKFMMPPTVAAPPFGAISDGIDQPTGAAAASPARASEIHPIASTGLVVNAAPKYRQPEQHAAHQYRLSD